MDGCTLRIRGMCARSDGPWKTERPVAQTLLVRLLHTSYMCQFPLPCIILLFYTDSSWEPHLHTNMCQFPLPCSWLILLFCTDSSCELHLHTNMCQFSLLCIILLFYVGSSCEPHLHTIQTCANFPHPVAG